MNQEDRLTALEIIENVQRNGRSDSVTNGGTSSVTVTIGGTDSSGMVQHDKLYLTDACTSVIEALQDAGYKVSMNGDDGLQIDKY